MCVYLSECEWDNENDKRANDILSAKKKYFSNQIKIDSITVTNVQRLIAKVV